MTTREKLLNYLQSRRGSYFSGEEIAASLGLSRASVWKAVNALRADGYEITAVPNKGYCLAEANDVLSAQGIRMYLDVPELTVETVAQVDSTNRWIRDQASSGAPEGLVLAAGRQTAGKGRSGRAFYSPEDTGVYLSLLLRPKDCSGPQALRFTAMAAVAMSEAIESVTGLQPQIKWVNDLFLNGKKICGILTEGAFSMESGLLDYAVLGVGVNVYTPRDGFPEDLKDIAGPVLEQPAPDMKNKLTGSFLNAFFRLYRTESWESVVLKYRQRSMVIGKTVQVLSGTGTETARVLGIDDACRLLVRYDSGATQALSYGEIRILI